MELGITGRSLAMKTALVGAIVVLVLGSTGCMWPAATSVHGTAAVGQPDLHQAFSSQSPQTEKPTRVIVVKYWRIQELFNSDRMKFEFFGAEATDRAGFPISFPLRFYPAVWTPALGTQHLPPDAGLVVFAEGRWPTHIVANDGRRCCEAPTTGDRHWHVSLQPMNQVPTSRQPAKGWDREEFPPLTPDKLDSVLKWNGSVTEADREMCCQQLEQLLEYWRKNPSPPSR
jgi:hypothetical protein